MMKLWIRAENRFKKGSKRQRDNETKRPDKGKDCTLQRSFYVVISAIMFHLAFLFESLTRFYEFVRLATKFSGLMVCSP